MGDGNIKTDSVTAQTLFFVITILINLPISWSRMKYNLLRFYYKKNQLEGTFTI